MDLWKIAQNRSWGTVRKQPTSTDREVHNKMQELDGRDEKVDWDLALDCPSWSEHFAMRMGFSDLGKLLGAALPSTIFGFHLEGLPLATMSHTLAVRCAGTWYLLEDVCNGKVELMTKRTEKLNGAEKWHWTHDEYDSIFNRFNAMVKAMLHPAQGWQAKDKSFDDHLNEWEIAINDYEIKAEKWCRIG